MILANAAYSISLRSKPFIISLEKIYREGIDCGSIVTYDVTMQSNNITCLPFTVG